MCPCRPGTAEPVACAVWVDGRAASAGGRRLRSGGAQGSARPVVRFVSRVLVSCLGRYVPLFPAVQPLPQSELGLPACPGQPKWSRWLCSPEGPAAPGQAGWRGQWFQCHSSRVPAWTTGLRAERPVCVRPFAVTLPALEAEVRGARSSARSVDPFCEVRVVAATARDGVVSCPGPPPSCDCPQLNEGCLCFRPQ